MPRYSAGVRTGTGSTTLPSISVYAAAAVGARIVEFGWSSTAGTAGTYALRRLTTTGTQGAGLTAAKWDPDSAAASCAAFTTHSGAPTLNADHGFRNPCAAVVGTGAIVVIPEGIIVPPGTANGLGLILVNGTGAVLDAYIVWDEDE